jgi:hypothetical protein
MKIRALLVLALSAFATACGSDNDSPRAAVAPQPQMNLAFVGTWVSTCQTAEGEPDSVRTWMKVFPDGRAESDDKVYANTSCTGAAASSLHQDMRYTVLENTASQVTLRISDVVLTPPDPEASQILETTVRITLQTPDQARSKVIGAVVRMDDGSTQVLGEAQLSSIPVVTFNRAQE